GLRTGIQKNPQLIETLLGRKESQLRRDHLRIVRLKPQRLFNALFRLYDGGKIRPVIYKNYSLEEVPEALSGLAGRRTYGKVIIAP
ncbi:MAG: zinc-binding dehydrogenase, partial [Myxococcales bacterium]|nr:zinc-binding dehydrogenase [Myxococcales bacterium]